MTATVTRIVYDGRTWSVVLTRTDLALPPPAPSDLPADVLEGLRAWVDDNHGGTR